MASCVTENGRKKRKRGRAGWKGEAIKTRVNNNGSIARVVRRNIRRVVDRITTTTTTHPLTCLTLSSSTCLSVTRHLVKSNHTHVRVLPFLVQTPFLSHHLLPSSNTLPRKSKINDTRWIYRIWKNEWECVEHLDRKNREWRNYFSRKGQNPPRLHRDPTNIYVVHTSTTWKQSGGNSYRDNKAVSVWKRFR